MKYLAIILLAVVSGYAGAYLPQVIPLKFGATTARTTVTNPWTFTSTTTMSKPLIVTTTDTATSTAQVGCIQTTATSTATPIRLVIGSIATSSATYRGTNTNGLIGWQYGTCPNLP